MKFYTTVLSIVCLLPCTVQADLVLSFSDSDLEILVGQQVFIDIIATQTDNGDLIDGGDLRQGADGLFLAGMRIENSSSAVASSRFVSAGPGFIDSTISPSTATELTIESADPLVPVFAANSDPTSMVLGTYSFIALTSGTTTFTLADPTDFDDWVFGTDAGGNDAAVFAGAQSLVLNVSAVPEPSSFVLLGSIAAVSLFTRRRSLNS